MSSNVFPQSTVPMNQPQLVNKTNVSWKYFLIYSSYFLKLNVPAMCPCPVWVCEHMRQVFSTFGHMQEFTGVWVRDPRIQKEDFWHAYMDYEICIHVSAIEIYRGHKGYNVIKQEGRNSLIILYISCLRRPTVWLSLRRPPVCGGDTASLCG